MVRGPTLGEHCYEVVCWRPCGFRGSCCFYYCCTPSFEARFLVPIGDAEDHQDSANNIELFR